MTTRRWVLLLVGAALLTGVFFALRARTSAHRGAAVQAEASARDRPVPVQVATVTARDVPIYLEGLGTVTAYNTVVVRPRVEGRLDAVLFQEGRDVHRGDVLARLDPRPAQIALRQAEAVAARDRALVATHRRTLERTRSLLSQHFVAQQEFDAALGALEQAQAALRASEAAAASARLELDYAVITSPIDGVTGLRQVDVGNTVRPSDATGLVLVRQIDPIAVLFTLPQDELPRVQREMARGPLRVEVFSRDGATALGVGELTVIDNQINPSTATARLKAVLANPQRALWPDQFVKARVLVTTLRNARVLPAAAVQRGPQGAFVYQLASDDRVSVRPVRVARIEGELAVIDEGVSVGDRVVSEGQSRLRAGAQVQPRAAEGASDRAGRGEGGSGEQPGTRDGGTRARRGAGAGRGGDVVVPSSPERAPR